MAETAKGGDIIFIPGNGWSADYKPGPELNGSIRFCLNNGALEVMRFDPDGTVTVRGEKVDSNRKIYEELVEWLRMATARAAKP